ncbi:DUF6786 family protein [Verrucomicrobiota bacterium]
MKAQELIDLFERGRKRCHFIGGPEAGVVVGLDLEGRLYAVLGGVVLHRTNPDALLGVCSREQYLHAGGDGLWPAPEGSSLGYHYATGEWRVPPGLSGAKYRVTETAETSATIRAEIDLINSEGLGVPAAFERRIALAGQGGDLTLTVTEQIEYLGSLSLSREECLIAPWSLAQFDCGEGCEVVFPAVAASAIRDLYDPSDDQRELREGLWHTRTDGGRRYQIGLGEEVEWIEYRDPRRGLRVRREAGPLPAALRYIDIADKPPDRPPDGPGVRFSIYSDDSGFMEIEAAGGCADVIEPGARMSLTVLTHYERVAP